MPERNSVPQKLNFRLLDVMRAGFGLAVADGGFIIAIQVITFLLSYFGANISISESDHAVIGVSSSTLLVSFLGMLNLSVIIFRITALARGVQVGVAVCYQQALRRWPMLILLYMIGSILLMMLVMPMLHMIQNATDAAMSLNKMLLLSMLMFTPYGILTCIYVIDQNKNPLQAIYATYVMTTQKISIRLLLNISILYALPVTINNLISATWLTPYLGLFDAIWFLFCHLLIIVIYAGFTVANHLEKDKQDPTKVIVV